MVSSSSVFSLYKYFLTFLLSLSSFVYSCEVSNLTEGSLGEELRNLIDLGQRSFSVNLIKSLFSNTSSVNILLSPSSIHQTLLLAYFGANGVTETEIQSLLGLSSLSRPEILKSYIFSRAFQSLRVSKSYNLVHVNKLYFDRSLNLNSCLMSLLSQEEIEALDFNAGSKSEKLINAWIAEKTFGKIKDLIPSGSLNSGSQVALVNAAYFKGNWASQFQVNETKRDNFYVRRDVIRLSDYMTQKGKFNYYTSEELRAHVLEMPYSGNDISMIFILPPFEENSLSETVGRLSPETLQGVMGEINSGFYTVDDLTVKIPKFKIEKSLELSQTLSFLGVPSLFDSSSSNLTRFLNSESDERISIEYATHKSFIEVNEEGTEAGAGTALFGFRSARPLFHKDFIANHPFLFLIYDKETHMILFMGAYIDPKA